MARTRFSCSWLGWIFDYIRTVGWGEYGTAGGEFGTLLSQEQDVMEENVTS